MTANIPSNMRRSFCPDNDVHPQHRHTIETGNDHAPGGMERAACPGIALDMREIGKGVAEVYDGTYQVGLITWSPNPYSGIVSTWYATYANGDETVTCMSRDEALECLRLQHAAVRRFARSLRSIRPASMIGQPGSRQSAYDQGYNSALRDVERLTQELVGRAQQGEGYTAVTGE
jgi:hypothetical protein